MTAQRDATMPTPLTVVPRGRAGKAPSPLTHNRPMIRAADVHVVMPQTFPSPIPLKVEAALRFSPDGNRHSQHESTIVPLTTLTMSPTTPTSTPTLKLTHKNNERVNHGNVTDLENGTTVIQDFHLLKIRRLKNFEDCTCPTDSHALLISVFKIWHGRMHVVKEVPNDHMYAKTPLQLLDRICHVFDNAEHFRHAVTLHSHLQSSKLSLIKSRTTKIDMLMASRKFRAGIEYLRQVQCNNVDCECRCEQTVEVKETNNNDQTQQQRKKKEKKRHSNRNKSNSGKSSNDDDADEEGQQQQQQKQQQQQPENLKGGGNQKSGKKRKLEELSVDEPLDAKKQRHFLSLDYESQKHLIKLERLKLQRQQFELEEKKVDVAERKDKRQFEIKKMRLEFEHQRNLKVQENFKELSKIVSRLGCALARQGKNEREVSERHVKEEDESDDNGDDEDDDSDDNDSDDDRDDGKNGGKKDDDGDDDDEGSDDDGDSDDDVQLDDDNESGENGGDGVEEVNGQDDSK